MKLRITRTDCIGLARPAIDVHTLGLTSFAQLLGDCGYRCILADGAICACLNAPDAPGNMEAIAGWISTHGITVIGLSYRLDPQDGARIVSLFVNGLRARRLMKEQGGPIRGICFAGLPKTCALVRQNVESISDTFDGDETASETLEKLGVEFTCIPKELAASSIYDQDRLAFGRDLIAKGDYLSVRPVDRSGCQGFGTRRDTLETRLSHSVQNGLPPLIRAHSGPFLQNRAEAVRLFMEWTRQLAAGGFLDILSIGTSQLTQSNFGEPWGDKPNGGGVPINSPEEYESVWQAARPMLVRTYAGTKDIRSLARMYEERINIAWHALSLWWFCRIDGRGSCSLRDNLDQHFDALRYIATTKKPYEPNVSHHFAFRGADDVTCIVASVLAARAAKKTGIRNLILQVMLNTPRTTWGVQDLAKARATLVLVRELEDRSFRVILQPRSGLDSFSPNKEKAKAQLAAGTALMDDIEPHNPGSPHLIHVVSFSEGYELADPFVIEESIKITRHALEEYRRLRKKGDIDDMEQNLEVKIRTEELLSEARTVIKEIESRILNPYTAGGLYQAFAEGFLPVPYLWECREELEKAVQWKTRLIRGSVKVVDEGGIPIPASRRMGFKA